MILDPGARGNANPSKQTLTGRETMAGPPTVKALAPAAREKRVATAEARMVGRFGLLIGSSAS